MINWTIVPNKRKDPDPNSDPKEIIRDPNRDPKDIISDLDTGGPKIRDPTDPEHCLKLTIFGFITLSLHELSDYELPCHSFFLGSWHSACCLTKSGIDLLGSIDCLKIIQSFSSPIWFPVMPTFLQKYFGGPWCLKGYIFLSLSLSPGRGTVVLWIGTAPLSRSVCSNTAPCFFSSLNNCLHVKSLICSLVLSLNPDAAHKVGYIQYCGCHLAENICGIKKSVFLFIFSRKQKIKNRFQSIFIHDLRKGRLTERNLCLLQ